MYLPTTTGPSVCHSLSLDKRKLFCLFVCRGTLSCYGVGAFFLSSPHGMHLVGPTQLCSFGWYVISAGHFPQKSTSRNLKIGFSALPTAKPCPLTSNPWSHRVLYWLGTGWWGLGLACAFLPCMSKICLLLIRLPWLACIVCCPFLTILWFPFPLWLAPLRGWVLLDSGLCVSSAHPFSCYYLLPYDSIIPAVKSFASILLGLFGPAVYSSPNDPVRPLVLLLHH